MKFPRHAIGVLWVLAVPLAVDAQTPLTPQPGSGTPTSMHAKVARPAPSPEFGTVGTTYKQFSALAFVPIDSSEVYSYPYPPYSGQVLRTVTSGTVIPFAANLDLPNGALVTYLELDGCDNTGGSGWVQGTLVVSDTVGNVSYAAPFLASDGSGCSDWNEDLSGASIVIDNFANHYWLLGYAASSGGFQIGLAGMVVGYHLQVPPAPVSPDFTDVPVSSPQFQFIEALYNAGVTAGCGGGNYCPNNPLTRGQMAVFLAKALGLSN